jgi:acetoin utilization protein AcuC
MTETATLIWRDELAQYELSPDHPLKPVRLTLAIDLMRAWDLLSAEGSMSAPTPANDGDLTLVHSQAYLDTVREAGDWSANFHPRMGLGTADNPIFPGMHEVSALIAGASILGVREVLEGKRTRTFSIAGGLHHAHRDRASGFCVYNDPAIAIATALRERPGTRVVYLDIDAHHGDGVQEAFYASAEVMTISLHETGRFLFPGTGFVHETGKGAGEGYSVNVPLPPWATDDCYRLTFEDVVVPLVRAFAPDLIVAQCGVDAHHDDPLTQLGMTLPGYADLTRGIVALADEVCGGRLAVEGGGGYAVHSVVPIAWAGLMATLLGRMPPEELPAAWLDEVRPYAGAPSPHQSAEDVFELPEARAQSVYAETSALVAKVRETLFPYHGLKA